MTKQIAIIGADGGAADLLNTLCADLGFEVKRGNEPDQIVEFGESELVFITQDQDKAEVYPRFAVLREHSPAVPVILVIDSDEVEEHRFVAFQQTEGRAEGYLVKPVNGPELVNSMKTLIAFPNPDAVSAVLSGGSHSGDESSSDVPSFFEDDVAIIADEAESALDALFVPQGHSAEPVAQTSVPPEIMLSSADVMSSEPVIGLGTIALDDSDLESNIVSSEPAVGLGTIALDDSDIESDVMSSEPAVGLGTIALDDSDIEAELDLSPSLDSPVEDSLDSRATVALEPDDIDTVSSARMIAVQKALRVAEEALARRKAEDEERRSSDTLLRQEINDLREKVALAHREGVQRQSETDRVIGERDAALAASQSLRTELDEVNSRILELDAFRHEVVSGQTLANAEIAGLKERLEELRGRLQTAQAELEKTHLDSKTAQARWAQKEAELVAKLSEVEREASANKTGLERQLNELTQRSEQLDSSRAGLQTELETLQADAQATKERLEKQLAELRDASEVSLRDAENRNKTEQEAQSESAQRQADELSAEIRDLKAELEQERAARTASEAEYGERVAELHSTHQSAVDSLRTAHKGTLSSIQNELEERLQAQAAKHATAIASLEEANSEASDGFQTAHQQATDALQAEHARSLERRQAEYMAEILELKRNHAQELEGREAELSAAQAAELEKVKRAHLDALAELTAENDRQRQATLSEHERVVDQLRAANLAEMESVKVGHQATLDSLNAEHSRTTERIQSSLDAAVASLKSEHERALTERVELHRETQASQRALFEERMDNQRTLHEREIEVIKGEHAQKLGALTRENASAFESIEQQHKQKLDELILDYSARISALEEQISANTEEAERAQRLALAERDEKQLSELDALRAELATNLREVVAEKDSLIEAERGKHAEAVTLARAEVVKLEEELGGRVSSLEAQLAQAQAVAHAADAAKVELSNELDALRAELETRTEHLNNTAAQLSSEQAELTEARARGEALDKENERLKMDAENERQARQDVEVAFNARAADIQAQYQLEQGRLETLEGALTDLNRELADREKSVAESRTQAEQAIAEREALAAQLTALQEQSQHREESLKKLRMAIAVANTFAGEVGSEDLLDDDSAPEQTEN